MSCRGDATHPTRPLRSVGPRTVPNPNPLIIPPGREDVSDLNPRFLASRQGHEQKSKLLTRWPAACFFSPHQALRSGKGNRGLPGIASQLLGIQNPWLSRYPPDKQRLPPHRSCSDPIWSLFVSNAYPSERKVVQTQERRTYRLRHDHVLERPSRK